MKRALLAAALATAGVAHAGRPCEEAPQRVTDVQRGLALAEATAKQLDATGAQVVVLARPKSYWRVVHKLNHCNTDHAALYRQGLAEFFLDRPQRYEAAYSALSPEAQSKLLPLLRDNRRIDDWHEPRYNMVAYPWSTRYQQSNQWALETLAGAMDPGAADRRRAQAWLQLRGYEPTTLRIDPLTRLSGRITRANIAFDDHPNHKRFSDRIETVTADSVFVWLQRSGLGEPMVVVR
jgi:hypothetical protein